MPVGDNSLLQAARGYAARGWPVFPCNPSTKRPLVSSAIEGEGGVKLASTDAETIRGWWRKWPRAMIGFATGARAGVFVVDIDAGEDKKTGKIYSADELIATLQLALGGERFPATVWSVTPRGGRHIYFAMPGGETIGNRGDLLGKGSRIDVRGEGGYVILPPSARPDGAAYQWLPPHGAPIAEASPALLDCILRRGAWAAEAGIAPAPARSSPARSTRSTRSTAEGGDRAVEKYVANAFDAEIKAVAGEGQGNRNHRLNLAAVKLGEFVAAGALDQAAVEHALEQAAADCGLVKDDGIASVRKTIASGMRKGLRQPRDLDAIRAAAAERARRHAAARYEFDSGREAADHFDPARAAGDDYDPGAFAALAAPPPSPPPPMDFDASFPDGGEPPRYTEKDQRDRWGFDPPPRDRDDFMRRLAFLQHTDLGNVERFRLRNANRFRHCPALGWLFWDRTRWSRRGAEDELFAAVHASAIGIQEEADWLAASGDDLVIGTKGRGDDEEVVKLSDVLRRWGRQSENAGRLSAVVKHAPAYLAIEPDQLDADPFKINVRNGTLIVRRGKGDGDPIEFRRHDPADLITKVAPVDYDPKASAPIYDEFLQVVQPADEMRRFLHQWGGLSLTGDMTEQRFVFCYGKGANGKTTLLEAWSHVVGDYGTSIPIETFISEGRGRNAGQATPDLAMLQGVRFVHTNEPEKGGKLSEGLIKLVTGGDRMKVRELNMPYFELQPLFKLMMSGNYKPKIDGGESTHGIWRRLSLVPWGVTVPKEKQDRTLPIKLRAEASGILNRLLDGLREWLATGLVLPDEVKTATEQYRSDSDPLGQFLDACTKIDGFGRVQTSELHRVFVAWAKASGEREWSSKGFSAAMLERGYERVKSDHFFWVGLRLTKSESDFVDHEGRPLKLRTHVDGVQSEDRRRPSEDDEIPF